MALLSTTSGFLYTVILLAITVGGFFAVRFGFNKELMTRLKDTNDVLTRQVEALTRRVSELEKRDAFKDGLIDTITQALERKNIKITIDGDMVTLTERKSGASSSIRPPRIKAAHPLTPAPNALTRDDLKDK